MLRSVCRMPSCRSREMRLRSPSMARARKCRSKKMFSTEGPTWRATRSNHIKSSRRNARRPFNKNSLPAGFPICSKETDMKDRSASTCCVADGSRGKAFKVRPSRRSHPNPAPAPARLFQQIVASKSSSRKPSARVSARFSGIRRSLSPDLNCQTNIRSRSESRYTSIAPSV